MTLIELERIANRSVHDSIDNIFLKNLYEYDTSSVYYKFLYAVAKCFEGEPSKIVELGSFKGRSTAFLSFGNLSGKVTSVDLDPQPEFYTTLKKLKNVDFYKGRSDSKELLDYFPDDSVSVCFFDTDHNFDVVSAELTAWFPKIKNNGILLFDDIHMNPGMTRFWEGLDLEKGFSKDLHWTGFGYAIKGV